MELQSETDVEKLEENFPICRFRGQLPGADSRESLIENRKLHIAFQP